MENLIPIIDQVLDSLTRGKIAVSNGQEVREALLLLRTIAVQREREVSAAADQSPAVSAVEPHPR